METSIAKAREILKKHNADYVGIKRGFGIVKDLILFNVPITRTTVALRFSEFTEENVVMKIANTLQTFKQQWPK